MKSAVTALVVLLCLTIEGRGAERFPISFWYGPPASANSLETWRTVAAAHFTIAGPSYPYSLADNRLLLDNCRQAGLRAMVVDDRVRPEMTADKEWRGTVGQVVADYAPSPALFGYYLYDEPGARWFPALGEMAAEFRRRDARHVPFINLYPNYAAPEVRGTATHRDYLRRYVETVRPTVISYDHYPLLDTGEDRPDYFENLEAVRATAIAAAIPFWSFVLAAPHEYYRDPTAEELQWQVFTSLAYGAQGICYFTYWPVPDLITSALVDAAGKPTARYDTVRELNRKILALGPILLGLRSTAVFHTGAVPAGCLRLSSEAVVQVPDDKPLLIGCFEDDLHNEFVMLVNRDYRNSHDLAVELRADVIAVASFDALDGTRATVPLEQRRFVLDLRPGEGRLFAIETRFAAREPFVPAAEINFDFQEHDEDWKAAHSLAAPVIEQGVLRSAITGADPYFIRTFLAIPPDRYRRVAVRMKTPGTTAQFYWQTAAKMLFDDARHVNFSTIADDEFHDYVIELDRHPGWKKQEIRAIRLDPAIDDAARDQPVEIDFVRGEQ